MLFKICKVSYYRFDELEAAAGNKMPCFIAAQ